jgi:hypothetical protein
MRNLECIFLGIVIAIQSLSYSFVQAQEAAKPERRRVDAGELQAGFQRIFKSSTETGWGPQLTASNFKENDVRRTVQLLARVPEHVDTIFRSEVDLSQQFLVSLDVDYRIFADLENSKKVEQPVSPPTFARVTGAAIDVQVKADFLKAFKTSKIEVSVRTLKSGSTTQVDGCYVWYAPFYDDREVNWDRFGPVSSPSKDELPPGLWAVWSVKGGKTGKRERLNLTAGSSLKDFDIDAPE